MILLRETLTNAPTEAFSLVGFISCLGAKYLFRKYDRKVLFLEIDCLLKPIGNYCLKQT